MLESIVVPVNSGVFSHGVSHFTLDDIDPYLDDETRDLLDTLPENSYLNLREKDGKTSLLYCLLGQDLRKIEDISFQKIRPANREQTYLADALSRLGKDLSCLTVTGGAGTGKTLMVLAWAINEHLTTKKQIVLTKSRVQVYDEDEEPMGELPGNVLEKMAPQLMSYESSLIKIMGKGYGKMFSMMIDRGDIQVVPLEFMRGIDFSDKIVICDEAQNLGRSQLLTLGTRVNKTSSLVLMGDIRQSDKNYSDEIPLIRLITSDSYCDASITSHIHLLKSERGPLVEIFQKSLY